MPALICAWREGIWPWPAWRTWPMTTCSTCSGSTPARSSAAWMAMPPSSVASREDEAAAHLADRGAGGAEDHGLGHRVGSPVSRTRGSRGSASMARADARDRHHRRPPRRPTPTPSSSASSRARASPTTSTAARCRRCSTAARRRRTFKHARRRPRRAASAGSSSGSARATSSTPSARGVAAAVAHGRARELGAQRRCAGSCPTTSTTHVAGALVEGTVLAAYRFDRFKQRAPRTTPPALERAAGQRAPRRLATPSTRADVVAEAVNAARDLQNTPGQRHDADARWPSARRRSPRSRRARRGRGPRRRSRAAAWARSPRSPRARDEEPRADHAALRAARAPAARCSALVGKAVTFDTRRHLDQARRRRWRR